jgi:anti-sigma factor RsiW
MVHASGHVDIAAYILGALDEPDNSAFEEHLLDCPRCQLDLIELQDVPDLLDTVKHDAPALLVPVPGPRCWRRPPSRACNGGGGSGSRRPRPRS